MCWRGCWSNPGGMRCASPTSAGREYSLCPWSSGQDCREWGAWGRKVGPRIYKVFLSTVFIKQRKNNPKVCILSQQWLQFVLLLTAINRNNSYQNEFFLKKFKIKSQWWPVQNRWGHFSLTWSFYFISVFFPCNTHYFPPWNILWLLQIQTSSSCFRRSENKSFLWNRDERGALALKWSSTRFLHPNILFLAVFFHWCLTWNVQPHGKAQPFQGTFSPFSQTQDIWAGLGEVLWENKDLKCFYLLRLIQVPVSPHPQSHCPPPSWSLGRMPRGSESFYFIKIEITAFCFTRWPCFAFLFFNVRLRENFPGWENYLVNQCRSFFINSCPRNSLCVRIYSLLKVFMTFHPSITMRWG